MRGIILFVFFLGATVQAFAQEPVRRWEIFGQFGGSFFTESTILESRFFLDPNAPGSVQFFSALNTVSLTKTGKLFTGLRIYLTSKDAIEASYSYSPTTSKREIFPLTLLLSQVLEFRAKNPMHLASFNYVRYGPDMGIVKPFVTGGLGFARFGRGGIGPTKFAANFGGGADIELSQQWSVRLEYRDTVMGHPSSGFLQPRGLIHNHGPSVGLAFKF